ncbi:MAG: DUF3047 domain-containing protein [Verrucomicrobiota bacterium]
MRSVSFLFCLFPVFLLSQRLCGDSLQLFGATAEEFEELWETRGFPLIASTEYEIKDGEFGVEVTGKATNANRAMARRLDVEDPTKIELAWSWRVRSELDGSVSERTKAGDDFAARVFVVFETSVFPTRTRAINYVWSAREPVGATFASPYTKLVAHIVMRNGESTENPAEWLQESRDVLADYKQFFGESPSVVTAVAIMVDTDNTDGYAEGDFRDLVLEISPSPEKSK